MIVDSSALVAIVMREPGYVSVLGQVRSSPRTSISAANLLEVGIVLSARLGEDARGLIARLLHEAGIGVVPVTDAHYGIAMEAWLRFGKGRHPAALDFGDCIAYATSVVAQEPLLAVGDDFKRTDCDLA
jgi:ribonuclease VapC